MEEKIDWKNVFEKYLKTGGVYSEAYINCLFCRELGVHSLVNVLSQCEKCPVGFEDISGIRPPCVDLQHLTDTQRMEIAKTVLKKVKDWDDLKEIRSIISKEYKRLRKKEKV